MQKSIYFLALLFLLAVPGRLLSQQDNKLHVRIGMHTGMSQLFHNTQYETTPLYNLYQFVAISHQDDYTWGDFESDYELRETFTQPRFGFHAIFTYGNLPVFAMAEAGSSPSTYQKMQFAVSAGMGKEFFLSDSMFCAGFMAGYKFVKDNGFGSYTLVNSIGQDEAREYAATFFDPKYPLGRSEGHLFMFRGNFGHDFGEEKNMRAGLEAFYELDLTPKIQREARMTVMGVQAFVRFVLK